MIIEPNDLRHRRSEYAQRLRAAQLREGFSYPDDENFVTRPYWPLEPKNKMLPHLWKWSQVRALTAEAGELIGLGRGRESYDRRVLALINPGAEQDFTLSGTLFGDIQLIKAGESAPCHRHTPCATRFMLEGDNGWTTVAGEKVHVQPGDIVFTGQNPWHDHGNNGPEDFIFFDVLDIPLLQFTATSSWDFDFASITGSTQNLNQPAQVTDLPNTRLWHNQLRPAFSPSFTRDPNHFAHLKWLEAKSQLLELATERGCAYDGIRLEMTQKSGVPIGPTMSVYTQMLRKGERTLTHRHTSSVIYVVIAGAGAVQIENQIFDFAPGDIFVIPSWNWHSFANTESEPCFLHSISDAALICKLNLYREQRRTDQGNVEDTGWISQVTSPESGAP